MNKNLASYFSISIIIIIGGIYFLNQNKSAQQKNNTQIGTNVGDIAPDFEFESIDGQTIKISDYLGQKAILITSTASWCSSCVFEAENLSPVYQKYKDKIEFISVSIDPTDNPLKLEGFKTNTNTPWIYTEPNQEGALKMINDYQLVRFEITYVIDQKGVIRFKDTTITSSQILDNTLAGIL